MKKLLSKDTILAAFQALEAELPSIGAPYRVVVVGGAALVLLYDARQSTRDVDALVSDGMVFDAARRVAQQLDLPTDWLNDGVKGFISSLEAGPDLYRSERLVVSTASVYQLLAMKLSAWRDDVDVADARLLLGQISGDQALIWGRIEPHVTRGDELKAHYAFLDLWETER